MFPRFAAALLFMWSFVGPPSAQAQSPAIPPPGAHTSGPFTKAQLDRASLALGRNAPPDLVFARGSDWQLVSSGHDLAEGIAFDAAGNVYFTDLLFYRKESSGYLFRIDHASGDKELLDGATGQANGLAFGPDGRLYGCAQLDKCICAWDTKTWRKVKIADAEPNDLVILRDGTIFYTGRGGIGRIGPGASVATLIKTAWGTNGIAMSADQRTLLVAEFQSDAIHGFSLDSSSNISGADRIVYKLAVPSNGRALLDGMTTLPDDRIVVSTVLGLQIAPPVSAPGLHIVVPLPSGHPIHPASPLPQRFNNAKISPDGEWVYVAFYQEILRRRLRPGFLRP